MTLAELSRHLEAELLGDPSIEVDGVAEPETARAGQVALLTDPARWHEAHGSQAAAFVVSRPIADDRPQLLVTDPGRALARLMALFPLHPGARDLPPRGIDPRAQVASTATVDPSAWVGPFVYVGADVVVQQDAILEPFTYVGAGATVGPGCRLGPRATLLEGVVLQPGVVLGPGAVVGWRGFGFWRDGAGWHPIPSRGGVVLERDVELGANSCVDAGTLGPTRIGAGAKIDNLVQVGHNGQVGERCLLCGQVGLAGSVTLEADCQLGGQVGVADHRHLGRRCRVAGGSGIIHDVAPEQTVAGYPAQPRVGWLRSVVIFTHLARLAKQVQQLSARVNQLMPGKDGPNAC